MNLLLTADQPLLQPISPSKEMGAYEALWLEQNSSFKSIAAKFAQKPGALPSELIDSTAAEKAYLEAVQILSKSDVKNFGIRINGAGDYPARLRDAKEPVELLYYQGTWELADSAGIAIVGTRNPTEQGIARARRLARLLVDNDLTVVSGLAAGIDKAAHEGAIEHGGRTIAVIGTRLGSNYPKENRALQTTIAQNHLLISQVPIIRYARQSPQHNRFFFPERNKTMSALTLATVIVEAGETSGTLIQARAALHQGRKLFLMDSLFSRPELTWPERFMKQGAIRLKSIDDLLEHITPEMRNVL